MKIAITGATGFIGQGLAEFLVQKNHNVVALSRNPSKAKVIFNDKIEVLEWSIRKKAELARELDGIDSIINLAGDNIGSSIWTKSKRKKILESRVQAGRLISELVQMMKCPPTVLIQASAVGYYGTRDKEILTERSEPGKGFLPEVAVEWEKSTAAVEASGVRWVIIRSGIVLSSIGGAFKRLALPYKLHIGTVLGSGEQWMPWIHYKDEINAIYFLITNPNANGIYNLAAPYAAQMKDICSSIDPTLFKVPPFLLKLFLGNMAEETILASLRVVPERLLKEGFQFKFKDISEAVKDIYGGRN